jgi:putative acetyltransferase
MQLRLATRADLDAIIALFLDTVQSVNAADYSPTQIEAWSAAADGLDRWRRRIESQHFLLAESAGELVGFASVTPTGHLDVLFVHKDHERAGIASQLYTAIETWALSQGNTELTSDVSLTAKPFFLRQGFEVLAQQTVKIEGVSLTNFRMRKLLRSNGD